jgi:WhiB family redox-sensing transcriptional regulator
VTRPRDEQEVGWRLRAACSQTTAHLFFPAAGYEHAKQRRRRERAALAICRRCPVRQACLEFAIEIRDRDAILGGTTPDQRRAPCRTRQSSRGVA